MPVRVRVFGKLLTSDQVLPGLPVASTEDNGLLPFWTVETAEPSIEATSHSPEAHPVGAMTYSDGTAVSLAILAGTPEIVIADTGRFTLLPDRRISHLACTDVDRSAVALDLIGVVLPYALHADGAWCMHASAVATAAGVIAFVAPRGTGKSTLATACMAAGCALVADDVVVLRSDATGVTVTPAGLPLRLHADTARMVGVTTADADQWGKVRVEGPLADAPLPLAAIYILTPAEPTAAASRVQRDTRAAALALLANGKITPLLGGAEAADALTRCVALAHATVIHDLAVPRDLQQLDEVVSTLLSWHAAVPRDLSRTPTTE